MREQGVVGVVQSSDGCHLLRLVRREDAQEVHPHLASHRWMNAMSSQMAKAAYVDVLLRREELRAHVQVVSR